MISPEQKKEIIIEILDRITKGESLRSILPAKGRNEYLPERTTFIAWLSDDKELSNQYARACEIRADMIFDEIFEMADDSTNDFMLKKIGNEDVEIENKEAIARSRLRIDARKWALSKMNPKKYGEKLELSGDAENPIAVTQTTIVWGGKEIKV